MILFLRSLLARLRHTLNIILARPVNQKSFLRATTMDWREEDQRL
jgi:hypothetical protein